MLWSNCRIRNAAPMATITMIGASTDECVPRDNGSTVSAFIGLGGGRRHPVDLIRVESCRGPLRLPATVPERAKRSLPAGLPENLDPRGAWLVLAAAMGVALVLVLLWAGDRTFAIDEWDFLTQRGAWTAEIS